MSDHDHYGHATLALDEAVPAPGGDPPRERALPRLGFGRSESLGRESGLSLVAAIVLTLACLGGVGIAAEQSLRWGASERDAAHLHESEQLRYFTLPENAPARVPASDPASAAAPRDRASRPAAAAPGAPLARTPADTIAGERPATDASAPADSREVPIGRPGRALPSPDRLGAQIGEAVGSGRGVRERSDCKAPCPDAAVAGYAPGTELARRDSLMRASVERAVERAGPPVRQPGFQIGLPGGGPTKEERQRDSTLHAEYRRKLERLLARFDSLKADSIARGLLKEPPERR